MKDTKAARVGSAMAWEQSKEISRREGVPLERARNIRSKLIQQYGSYEDYLKASANGATKVAITDDGWSAAEPKKKKTRKSTKQPAASPKSKPKAAPTATPAELFQKAGEMLEAAGDLGMAISYLYAFNALANGIELDLIDK